MLIFCHAAAAGAGRELAPEHRDRIELDPAEIAAYAFHDPELIDTLSDMWEVNEDAN